QVLYGDQEVFLQTESKERQQEAELRATPRNPATTQRRTMRLGCTGLRVLAVFFTVLMVSANTLEIVLSPEKPKIGGSVTFNVPGITEGIRFFDWYRGNDTSSANQIIRFNNGDGSTSRGQKSHCDGQRLPQRLPTDYKPNKGS
ncbi:unnamed protein product, partial [Staurois parvus]